MKYEDNFQEMQILEQNMQNLLLQKQSFQMELVETNSASKEIEDAGEDIFKIIGHLMIKANKDKVREDLNNKKKILDLRIKAMEKQESSLTEKLEKIREKIINKK